MTFRDDVDGVDAAILLTPADNLPSEQEVIEGRGVSREELWHRPAARRLLDHQLAAL